jgi:hypothetical protein
MVKTSRLWLILVFASIVALLPNTPPARAEDAPIAPTYRVYATRIGLVGNRTANGHTVRPRDRFVALPSWSVLAKQGSDEFRVRVTYRGRSVVLPVWDVGPWNTRDDWWAANRRYNDLPVGKPMAQAAYLEGYNGGRDEFGRRIGNPAGIDIADGAYWDDLGMSEADWVEVTFLWLGRDPQGPVKPVEPVAEPGTNFIDDDKAVAAGTPKSLWYRNSCGVGGRHAWTYSTTNSERSTNRARWQPTIEGDGFYEVQVYIPNCGAPATESASYRLLTGQSEQTITVNQAGNVGKWVSLGVHHLHPGSAVELTDVTKDEGRSVRFDTVRWVPRQDITPPTVTLNSAALNENGGVALSWTGQDDMSGVATYDLQVRTPGVEEWTDWLIATEQTQAEFPTVSHGVYEFRLRARDWVGNVQEWNEEPDARVERPKE